MALPIIERPQYLSNSTREELESLVIQTNGYLTVEHKDSGRHGAVTADSVSTTGLILTDSDMRADGDVFARYATGREVALGDLTTVNGTTLVGSESSRSCVLIGGVTNGYLLMVRTQSTAFTGSTHKELSIYSLAQSSTNPILRLGNLSGTYTLLAGGGGQDLNIGGVSGEAPTIYNDDATIMGGWQTYNPAWTAASSNPAIGNGSIVGRYTRLRKTVRFEVKITMGTTTTYGTGDWRVSIPSAAHADSLGSTHGYARDDSTSTRYLLDSGYVTTTTLALFADVSTANFSSTVPFTWATSDILRVTGTYEEA